MRKCVKIGENNNSGNFVIQNLYIYKLGKIYILAMSGFLQSNLRKSAEFWMNCFYVPSNAVKYFTVQPHDLNFMQLITTL